MSIIANNLLQGDEGYNLTRSLRFRSSASAYLNRTSVASPTNNKIFTISKWIKRGVINDSSFDTLFGGASSQQDTLGFGSGTNNAGDSIQLRDANVGSYNLLTTQVFRDPSAWYHLVASVDTTQATDTNRVKLYINGTQVTSFATASYPSQNYVFEWNAGSTASVIARRSSGNASWYFDGYLTEVNFIDGQALTPSSFGEANPITGVWKPKKYGGTYGTNGFFLPFSDNASTTTLGNDFSGNGNNWTTNNISLTAGTTYDSMVDVPTISALASNYCVLNPLDDNPSLVLTNGNLNGSIGSASWVKVRATFGMPTGKWYFEYTPTSADSHSVGIMRASDSLSGILGAGSFEYGYWQAGYVYAEGGLTAAATYTTGDVIGITFDAATREVKFYKNNTLQVTDTVASTDVYFPTLSVNAGNGAMNFGQRPFSYTPPTGFVALNTFNLPEPSIKAGNKYMDATLYTGINATLSVANTAGFQPDLVWLKTRSTSSRNTLFDSIRGITKPLWSDSTDAEGTATAGTGLTAFASNGFTLGTEIAGTSGSTNTSGATYVGWQWKANGTGVSNTAGSITSTVSANPTAGFSVVTYTGNGSNATVGHGLGVAPSMIIIKSRVNAYNWVCYNSNIGNTNKLYLDLTDGSVTDSTAWNNTSPTSSTFSLGSNVGVNQSSSNYVAYCFAEVAGYSKFGSYTGNGSTDGTFVHLGFRPKFLMVKRTDTTAHWIIDDSTRNPSNIVDLELYPSLSNAESSDPSYDFLSNGFKLRVTSSNKNASGGTYIYMAFAESPFKYSLGR